MACFFASSLWGGRKSGALLGLQIDRAFAVAVTLEKWCWHLNDLPIHLNGTEIHALSRDDPRSGEASRGTATCDLFSMRHSEESNGIVADLN